MLCRVVNLALVTLYHSMCGSKYFCEMYLQKYDIVK